MENSTSSEKSAVEEVVSCTHFVLLHHGYHGAASDFYYLSGIAEDALKQIPVEGPHTSHASAPHFVFVHPQGSDRLGTEEGVVACARRYIARVYEVVAQFVSSRPGTVGADGSQLDLHFSAVGHSMGGLILRYAFPQIMADVRQLAMLSGRVRHVHWDTFVTMATPHLGVLYMRSPVMTFLGGVVGHHLSTAIADLFSKNALITHDLVTDESLAAWAQFKRRVVLNVVNDDTVMVYSSSFVIPLSARERSGAALPLPSSTTTPDVNATASSGSVKKEQAGEVSESTVAEAARGPSHDKEHPNASQATPRLDVPNGDASVAHLAEHGIFCASTVAGLRRNGYELRTLSDALWPVGVLPEQRKLAERILSHAGPLELHLVDFRPLRDAELQELPAHVAEARAGLSLGGRAMTHLGAHSYSHAALACKRPFYYPAIFGFVSEYVVSEILGIHLTVNGSSAKTPNASFAAV